MKRFKLLSRILPLLGLMTLFLSGCGIDTLSAMRPRGPVAQGQLSLIILSAVVMAFVLIVVFTIYFYVIIRYRKRKGDDSIPVQVEGNHLLETLWTIIPIILLIIIAVPSIMYTFKDATNYTKDKNAIHINVTGHQFWWQFQYPDEGINTAYDLVIPTGKDVSIVVNSADVSHAFWVPSLAGKIDANPGDKNNNIMYFEADTPGIYSGECAELCGDSHALMLFKVRAVSPADYAVWLQQMKAAPAQEAMTSTDPDVAAGAAIFKASCVACHATDVNGNKFGPNLNGFSSQVKIAGIMDRVDSNGNDVADANLAKWISDPSSVKPGATMPIVADPDTGMPLSKEKVAQVVKYLDTLKLK